MQPRLRIRLCCFQLERLRGQNLVGIWACDVRERRGTARFFLLLFIADVSLGDPCKMPLSLVLMPPDSERAGANCNGADEHFGATTHPFLFGTQLESLGDALSLSATPMTHPKPPQCPVRAAAVTPRAILPAFSPFHSPPFFFSSFLSYHLFLSFLLS